MRNFFSISFFVFLIACGQSEYDIAFDAYQNKDYETAFKKISVLANSGDSRAQNIFGLMHERSLGVEGDYIEAGKWYRKAAEKGVAESQIRLAQLYIQGLGVSKDYWKAMKWARKSAVQGNSEAEANIGYMFHDGIGVKQDYIEAVKWYRKAAEKGWVSAEHDLGVMYETGRGVEKNISIAIEWYRKAADKGYFASQKNLLDLYQNNTKTFDWFVASAKNKDLMAQYHLGSLYYSGEQVEQSYVQAYAWIGITAVAGYKPAQRFRDQIANNLKPEELTRAKLLAKKFWEEYGLKTEPL